MKPPIFRPAAAADVEDAYRWYEDQRVGLGDEFLTAVSNVIESLITYPERYPVVYRQTRRINLRRYPYSLFCRIIEDQVVVVACMHGRRQPRRWQSRNSWLTFRLRTTRMIEPLTQNVTLRYSPNVCRWLRFSNKRA